MAVTHGTQAVVLDADAQEGIVALLASALDDLADGAPEFAAQWVERARRQLLDA